MIISRTPLRISFAGGGTDFKGYYSKRNGAVLSTAINKYMYVTINKKFDDKIRVSYSETEIVDSVGDLKHELVKEALKMAGLDSGLEITTIADVPSKGTGLGSSSALTVGLLRALYAFKGEFASPERLAKEACQIEIDILKKPIGKQDQYAAAFGGMNLIEFRGDETVDVTPIALPMEKKLLLEKKLLAFYTGVTRESSSVLTEQKQNTNSNMETLDAMKNLSFKLKEALEKGETSKMGSILNENWELKKTLASGISNKQIEEYYAKAISAGATGGKLLGAGGGGFLLFYCEGEGQKKLQQAMKGLKLFPFNFEPAGSRIIFMED